MYLYFSTQRPVGLGTIPQGLKISHLVNFDRREYCPEIGREAWGFFFTEQRLTGKDLAQYELTGFSLEPDDGKEETIIAKEWWSVGWLREATEEYLDRKLSDAELKEMLKSIDFESIIHDAIDEERSIYDDVIDAVDRYFE